MFEQPAPKRPFHAPAALTIAELEAAVQMAPTDDFWSDRLPAFRQTVIVAIRETSDALSSQTMAPRRRAELEDQLVVLRGLLIISDQLRARPLNPQVYN